MNTRLIQEVGELTAFDCRGLVLTNYGASGDCKIMLPTMRPLPDGPIIVLGSSEFAITLESVEKDKLITPDGYRTSCCIPAEHCIGSETTFVNLFGEAWQVTSNVPLLFE